ncbi:MAG: NTP transferase domain-containing protein [Nanoarchaeota archaeon]|nr:NTP transferase domain-containing protein [Nanoarchaeota archaeon]
MKAVILAAGSGVRMRPLTDKVPKCLIPIGGRPFLSYLVSNLQEAGITSFVVVIGHLGEQIKDFFAEESIDAEFIEQDKPGGTAEAVLLAEKHVKGGFIVVGADNLWSPDDMRLMLIDDRFMYMAAKEVDNPGKYGVLQVDGERLLKILEKPKHPPSNLINTGLYKLTKEIFPALKGLKPSPRGELELTDALTALAAKNKVKIKVLHDYWLDLGQPSDIPEIEAFLGR